MTRDNNEIGLAVVGVGGVAPEHLNAIVQTPGARLVAVVSRTREKVINAAQEFGALRWYQSYAEVLEDKDIDAIVLCTPTATHLDMCIMAARSGKHILVEKPIAHSVRDAERIVAEARAAGITLMVGHVLRFTPVFKEAKSLMEKGLIGRPLHLQERRLVYRPDLFERWAEVKTGTIQRTGTHSIDLALWLLDFQRIRVFASVSYNIPGYEGDAESDFAATIETSDGVIASFHHSFTARCEIHDTVIAGDNDYLLVEGWSRLFCGNREIINRRTESKALPSEGFIFQMREFVEALQEGRETSVSGEEAIASMSVVEAAERSARNHQVIEVVINR